MRADNWVVQLVSSWVEQMAACLADKKVDCWVAKWAGLKAEKMGKSVVVESALKKVGSLVSMLVTLLMVNLLAVQSVGK